MPTKTWIFPGNGFWDIATNWSDDLLPGIGDDVVIYVHGNITVTHRTGTTNIKSLTSQEAFVLSGGTLSIIDPVTISNFRFSQGTINGLTITEESSLRIQYSNVYDDQFLTGTINNQGTINYVDNYPHDGVLSIGTSSANAIINNEGVFNAIYGNAHLVSAGTASNQRFNNSGTFHRYGDNGTTNIDIPFFNTGR